MAVLGRTVNQRFIDMIEIDPSDLEGHWLWKGYVNESGYPHFRVKVAGFWKTIYAHHWAYMMTGKIMPPGFEHHHRCRIRRCVRPSCIEARAKSEHERFGRSFARD